MRRHRHAVMRHQVRAAFAVAAALAVAGTAAADQRRAGVRQLPDRDGYVTSDRSYRDCTFVSGVPGG